MNQNRNLPNWWGFVTMVLLGLSGISGCAVTHSYSHDGPMGTVSGSSELYAGGLVQRTHSESSSEAQYRQCMADRASQRQSWSSQYVDDQATCFGQTTSGRALTTGPMPYLGYGGYSGYGYGYGQFAFSPTGGAAGVR